MRIWDCMEHVVVRALEHLAGDSAKPALGFAVETRDRPGPAYKEGSSPDDVVWVPETPIRVVRRARSATWASAVYELATVIGDVSCALVVARM